MPNRIFSYLFYLWVMIAEFGKRGEGGREGGREGGGD